jgi:hypothetical protein
MERNAARLLATGQLRDDLTLGHVRHVLYSYTAPETYEILVLQGGWSWPNTPTTSIAACTQLLPATA